MDYIYVYVGLAVAGVADQMWHFNGRGPLILWLEASAPKTFCFLSLFTHQTWGPKVTMQLKPAGHLDYHSAML